MFLSNLRKKYDQKHFLAFNFSDDNFSFIELKKENNSFFPLAYISFESSKLLVDGIFYKKEALEYFKKVFKVVHSDIITISEIDNKKLLSEISSVLKIAGFRKIIIKKNNIENILPLLIKTKNLSSRYPEEQKIFNAIFLNKKIYFYLTRNGIIENKKIINSEILDYDFLSDFLNKNILEEQEVYLSGDIKFNLEIIKEMFYLFGLKTHLINIWQNINNTSEKIPKISLLESHQYIKSTVLALPELKKIEEKIEKNTEINNNNVKKQSEIEKKVLVQNQNLMINEEKILPSTLNKEKEKKEEEVNLLEEAINKATAKILVKNNQENNNINKKNPDLELKTFRTARVYYLEKKKNLTEKIKIQKFLPKKIITFLKKNKIPEK